MWLRISCLLVDMLVETWSTVGKLLTDSLCCSIRSCLLQVVLVDSIDRYLVDMLAKYWPCIGQVSTDTWPIFLADSQLSVNWVLVECQLGKGHVPVKTVGQPICVSVECRLSNGQYIYWYSIDISPILDLYSTYTWLTVSQYISCVLAECQPLLGDVLTECWLI